MQKVAPSDLHTRSPKMKLATTISRLIAVAGVLVVAAAAIALGSGERSSSGKQRPAAHRGSTAARLVPAGATKLERTASQAVSATPLGPPPDAARAKPYAGTDGSPKTSPR